MKIEEAALAIGGLLVAAKVLPNLKFPTITAPSLSVNLPGSGTPSLLDWIFGNPQATPPATTPSVIPVPFNGFFGTTVPLLAETELNGYIDSWFAGAGGIILGLGSYDPTNWTAFVPYAQIQYVMAHYGFGYGMTGSPLPVFPSLPTGYFDAKVAQYQNRGYTQPGGLGY